MCIRDSYNAKKKKTRDKIPDYYERIRQSKQEKLFHEAIFPVSYTHLDVYKRQPLWPKGQGKNNKIFSLGQGESRRGLWAVSYTHLDVYKRQGYGGERRGVGMW